MAKLIASGSSRAAVAVASHSPIGYRIVPAAVPLILFLSLSALFVSGETDLYGSILEHWGIRPFRSPFVDLHALLASWECARQGIDVFSQNPCDVLGRQFDYSPILLAGFHLGIAPEWTGPLGFAIDLIFLASFALLPPTRRPWGLSAMVMATTSTMVAFAVERANLDVVIFLLALLIGYLAVSPPPSRWLAYPVALFAAVGMKYYPITLMILALRERAIVKLVVGVVAAGTLAVVAIAYFDDFQKAWALLGPGSYYRDLFGATNLPMGVGAAFGNAPAGASPIDGQFIVGFVFIFLLSISAAIAWLISRSADFRQAFSGLSDPESIFLVMGSALIVGCFFAGQSTDYRGIFLLLVIPGLLAIVRGATLPSIRWTATAAVATTVFLMWGDCIREHIAMAARASQPAPSGAVVLASVFWVLRECAWWWLIGVLAAPLVAFVLKSRPILAWTTGLKAGVKTSSN